MPVEAPDGTFAVPAAPLSSITSTSIVGFPRESRVSLACTKRMAASPILLQRARPPRLGHRDGLLHSLGCSRHAHDIARLPVVIVEVPGVQPYQWDLVDQRISDLTERPVRPTDSDHRLAGQRDDCVARVANARKDRELDVWVRRGLGRVPARENSYRVPPGLPRTAASRLHHTAPAAADQRHAPPSELPPYLLGEPQRFPGRPFAADDGNYHGSHYSRQAATPASAERCGLQMWVLSRSRAPHTCQTRASATAIAPRRSGPSPPSLRSRRKQRSLPDRL